MPSKGAYTSKADNKKKATKGKKRSVAKRKAKGVGMAGSTSRLSKAEERVLAQGLEGKKDVSTRKKLIKALDAEHKKTGEAKSSYSQRTKRNPKVTTLDTRTGKRTTVKVRVSPTKKAALKRQKKNVKAGKRAAKKVQRRG